MRLLMKCSIVLVLMTITLAGCQPDKSELERKKWEVEPSMNNKLPYGSYLAYSSLKYLFPEAEVQVLPEKFRYTSIDDKMRYNDDGHTLMILNGLNFYVSEAEWGDLKRYIASGNEVMLFCTSLDNKIEQDLKCQKEKQNAEFYSFYASEKDNNNILTLNSADTGVYGYTGRSLKGYFNVDTDTAEVDTNADELMFSKYPDTLGFVSGKPDFISYAYGDGHLTIHAAPLVLSNYFLLQDRNEQYFNGMWSNLPGDFRHIYWSDYYNRSVSTSWFGQLFKFPATKLGLWLAIIGVLLFVLFEGKRKQRIIKIIPPLKNESVSFVETVGRLYFNKGNHSNLSHKMIMQFLEWVRTHYHLNTNLLNDDFMRQLTIKSGQPEPVVKELLNMIHEIRLGTAYIDDAYIYQLYHTIQSFYKTKRN